jgi:L-lactate dehydrogenase complex protein LldF
MLAEECELNPFLIEKGIDVVESDLGERILQLMNLARVILYFRLSTSSVSR